jgi:hypothetical protein
MFVLKSFFFFPECQPATVPENGYILGNVHTIGGKIKYVCTDSKEVLNAVCLSNGQWSATTNCTTGISRLYISLIFGYPRKIIKVVKRYECYYRKSQFEQNR